MILLCFCEPDVHFDCQMALFTCKDDNANNCRAVSWCRDVDFAQLQYGEEFEEILLSGYYANPKILLLHKIDQNLQNKEKWQPLIGISILFILLKATECASERPIIYWSTANGVGRHAQHECACYHEA